MDAEASVGVENSTWPRLCTDKGGSGATLGDAGSRNPDRAAPHEGTVEPMHARLLAKIANLSYLTEVQGDCEKLGRSRGLQRGNLGSYATASVADTAISLARPA